MSFRLSSHMFHALVVALGCLACGLFAAEVSAAENEKPITVDAAKVGEPI